NSLETKANYLLASSGIIVGLLFGFGATLLEKFIQIPNLSSVICLLLIGIALFVVTILLSSYALRIKAYRYTTLHINFYNADGTFDEEFKNRYKEMNPNDFLDDRINEYLMANKQNFEENEYKASKIKFAQILFFIGMITIPFTVLLFTLGAILK
ncbi:MAG: hypothetical protein M3O68_03160, partial [Thermoproteota archaeon]|nr:hypothetical protein [Thermoproteota archaeon]